MFHNNMWSHTQRDKSKSYKTKKLKFHSKENPSKHSKHSRNAKLQKKHKNFKLKNLNTVSDYVGPERLTKRVGIFNKGKMSDSISRIEKIMPKEVKARVLQDLHEVLKLTSVTSNCKKYENKKNIHLSYGSVPSEKESLRSSSQSSQNLCYKTRFSNNSWKNKLQNSVGVASVNSVLASVNEPRKTQPVKELQFLARNVIVTKINPFIKEVNSLLFPTNSNKDKIKKKLQQIKNELVPTSKVNSLKASPSNTSVRSFISSNAETNISQKFSNADNFHLSPIFTGEDIYQDGITKIFPNVSEFIKDTDNLSTDSNSIKLPNEMYDYEIVLSQAASPGIGLGSAMTFAPTSPTTSDNNSPALKFQMSPIKFKPQLGSTPTVYFRHKMF